MVAELPPRQMPPELAQLLPSPCQGLCLFLPLLPILSAPGIHLLPPGQAPPDLCPPPHSHCQCHPKRDDTQSLR